MDKDTVTIELTKEEAQLLTMLYRVPVNTNLEAATQVMKQRLILDGLMEKVNKAFSSNGATPPAAPAPAFQPKRKRH
jgi:hypothetical protein